MYTSNSIAALLSDMETEAKKVSESTNDKWLMPRSLHPDAAKLLNLLAKAAGAKRMLEIGTSVGYSTVHLALAAQETGGHVTTLELLPAKYEQAKANLLRGGLSDVVTQHLGDALEILPTLSGPWDLVFLDPEKELYEQAWKKFSSKVRIGGVVVADNVVSHASDLSGYVEMIRADDRFETVTVPIGQGLEISYRRC
jgi:predicted O-methyltransferase YrrM